MQPAARNYITLADVFDSIANLASAPIGALALGQLAKFTLYLENISYSVELVRSRHFLLSEQVQLRFFDYIAPEKCILNVEASRNLMAGKLGQWFIFSIRVLPGQSGLEKLIDQSISWLHSYLTTGFGICAISTKWYNLAEDANSRAYLSALSQGQGCLQAVQSTPLGQFAIATHFAHPTSIFEGTGYENEAQSIVVNWSAKPCDDPIVKRAAWSHILT